MKKSLKIIIGVILLIAMFLAVFMAAYPHIEFQKDNQLIALRYSDDISEFEDELSLDERYTYNGERDITITGFDFKKFLCFYVLIMPYEEGNLIESMYTLEASYIDDFLQNAVIEENLQNVDVAKLIDGKEAIISNDRYVPEDYDEAAAIYYVLHDEYQVMFIYEVDDLLVLQVGYPDEGPKYIAYQ